MSDDDMNLVDIRRELRAGHHPIDFGGEFIGDGGQRAAYLVGNYVIKDRVPAWHMDRVNYELAVPASATDQYRIPTKHFAKLGVASPKQWAVGAWVVQPYYRPLNDAEKGVWKWLNLLTIYFYALYRNIRRRVILDIHTKNLGVCATTGLVVCYDW